MAAGVTMNVRARESGGACGGKPIRAASEGNNSCLKAGADDTNDWQSVVKEMLSIHLPTSRMAPKPIVTSSSPTQPLPAPKRNSSPFGEEGKRARKVPELESLQSGSPRVSDPINIVLS